MQICLVKFAFFSISYRTDTRGILGEIEARVYFNNLKMAGF